MNSYNTPTRRRRISAGIMTVAAAASVTGVLSAAATANAAPDAYVALSVGLANDNPPVQTVGGMSIGPDANQARISSLSNCQNNGGSH